MRGTLSILLVLLAAVPVLSQAPAPLQVKLQVSADASTQAPLERCLRQELERLENVQVAAEAHHWLFHILLITLKPNQGYVLSLILLENTTIEFNNQAVYIPDLHAAYVDTEVHTLCVRAVEAFDRARRASARTTGGTLR